MKEKIANENQSHEEEPSLFEEKQEPSKKGKGKLLLVIVVVATAIFFWPKGQIQGEAVLQAERFAKIGLTSSGILTELLHETGERVKKGEIIARFENPELRKQFEEKKLVREILEIDKERLMKAVEFLTQEQTRKQMLFENGVIGRAVLDRSIHDLDEANQALKAKVKEIESAEGDLKFMQYRIESLALKAPFDGVPLSNPAPSLGNSFREGEFVLEFANPESYFLEVLISEKQMHKITPGNAVRARFYAVPGEIYEGEVVRTSPRTTDEIEKVFKVRHVVSCEIRLNGLPPEVRYGMRASVKINTTERSNEDHDRGTNLSN